MAFTDVIQFELNIREVRGDRELEAVGQELIDELAGWCSQNLRDNFILIEHASVRIAGGWVDNRDGWEKEGSRVRRDDYAWQSRYELRCSGTDANWFLLKWT
jgi:hypothetical protein